MSQTITNGLRIFVTVRCTIEEKGKVYTKLLLLPWVPGTRILGERFPIGCKCYWIPFNQQNRPSYLQKGMLVTMLLEYIDENWKKLLFLMFIRNVQNVFLGSVSVLISWFMVWIFSIIWIAQISYGSSLVRQ